MKKALAVLVCAAMMFGMMPAMTPAEVRADDATACGGFSVTGGTENTDYTFKNGVLTILTRTELKIENKDKTTPTSDIIEVTTERGANITLSGVNIAAPDGENAFHVSTGAQIKLEGSNYLTGGSGKAGMAIDDIGIIMITSAQGDGSTDGSLTANGGVNGAGIRSMVPGGTTFIAGGTITANGGTNAAGIGGCGGVKEKNGGNIHISGGLVTATGGENAAGIGGGSGHFGSSISIKGGTVTAKGGTNGAGIGGGSNGPGAYITISGGSVNAIAGAGGNDIGGGSGQAAVTPTNGQGSSPVSASLVKVQLEGISTNTKVDDVTLTGADYYGKKELCTDEAGMLYLWLPDQAGVTGASVSEAEYKGKITAVSGETVSGTLHKITNAEKIESKRIWGGDRYGTMAEAVTEAFPDGCDTSILVSGADWPDALAASSLAGAMDCPVLITDPDQLNGTTAELLASLKVKNVIIVGGTAAVSDGVKSAVEAENIATERIWGNDRTQTADMIARRVIDISSADTIIICSGQNFPDALSISSYAYAQKMPILLTGSDGTLTAESLAIAENFGKAVIIGGEGAVSPEVEKQLTTIKSVRYAGDDRYGTSTEIINNLFGGKTSTLAVATGRDYPDALVGAALAGKSGGAILLADGQGSALTTEQKTIVGNAGSVLILGGPAAVSDAMKTAVDDALK